MRNPYYGGFFQDSWRLSQNFTLNLGLRYEFENGITEAEDRWITEFNPRRAVCDHAARAGRRTRGVPSRRYRSAQFSVLGGSLYAGAPGATGKSWAGESMWMPRASAAYKLGERTVLKAGYGLFYDTLNAADYTTFNQLGYTSSTVNVPSTDFGQTWLMGNPQAGIIPIVDPFPVRANGERFEDPLADSLGANAVVGSAVHLGKSEPQARAREPVEIGRAARGVRQHVGGNRLQRPVRRSRRSLGCRSRTSLSSYYASGNARDASAQTLLQQQVTNPFYIENFASLRTSDPALYDRMANNAFFQARTTQRANLIRAYPHLNGNPLLLRQRQSGELPLLMNSLPLGVVKAHSLEITVARRYSNGLSANFAFSANDVTENRIVEAYDREPTEWQPSLDSRPWRMSGGAVYELPFGANRTYLRKVSPARFSADGRRAARSSTSRARCSSSTTTCSSTAISTASRKTIRRSRLNRDGTLDLSKSWFNTEGFVTAGDAQPASYQKRGVPVPPRQPARARVFPREREHRA